MQLTFRETTAPGYFDFSDSQNAKTLAVQKTYDGVYEYIYNQEQLMKDIFSNWAGRDYSAVTVSRTPFVALQLRTVGLGWFRGTEAQAAQLANFILAGFDPSLVVNINAIFTLLSQDPFNWAVLNTLQIVYGLQAPAFLAETLLIYSDSGGLPATPPNVPYVPRDWNAPAGWVKLPSSATYVSYGVLSGGNIVWSAPYDVDTISFFFSATLGGLPSPDAGDVGIVEDDGTDDTSAQYFYDGVSWGKFSTPYDNQGLASDGIPSDPPQSVVVAPETPGFSTASQNPPPVSGPSKGYGIYAGLSITTLLSSGVEIIIDLTDDGVDNLSAIIHLLRRVKPTITQLVLIYTNDSNVVPIEIIDSGELF